MVRWDISNKKLVFNIECRLLKSAPASTSATPPTGYGYAYESRGTEAMKIALDAHTDMFQGHR